MLLGKYIQPPIILPLDLTDSTKVDCELRNIHQKYGDIDILVNAACYVHGRLFKESVDDYRKIMEINCNSPI